MIKVNLLDSVTERSASAAVVEEQVSNPKVRVWLIAVGVFAVLGLVMLIDFFGAASAHENAQAELTRQQQIAEQMAAINREQAELEKKINDINTRIDAIKKLRASQQGPVALLSDINTRIPSDPGFRLESIEQKNGELTITGQSPNEYAVTQFGRSLEFSSGLFQNVSIAAERKDVEVNQADYSPAEGPLDLTIKPQVFKFEIKCKYSPVLPQPAAKQSASGNQTAPANQVAQK
ncbi:MAG: type pilus assembly protein PilN [Acidobacteriota bacterium]|jgi:Tfp pilus assembly protein PilN|nr:type pilus assembly protein PilN [Acidobacteriota bacterium]